MKVKVPVKLPGGGTGYAYRWVKQGQAPGSQAGEHGGEPSKDPVADVANELLEALAIFVPFTLAVKITNEVQEGSELHDALVKHGGPLSLTKEPKVKVEVNKLQSLTGEAPESKPKISPKKAPKASTEGALAPYEVESVLIPVFEAVGSDEPEWEAKKLVEDLVSNETNPDQNDDILHDHPEAKEVVNRFWEKLHGEPSKDVKTAKVNSEKMFDLFWSKNSVEHKDYSARRIGDKLDAMAKADPGFRKGLRELRKTMDMKFLTHGRYPKSDGAEVADALFSSWASSSYDHKDIAIIFQEVIVEEFDLSDFLQRGRRGVSLATYEPHRAALKRIARVMYDVTQEFLKEKGITELWLARGVKARDAKGATLLFERVPEEAWKNATPYEAVAVHQPLTSWSSNLSTAVDFSDGSTFQMVMVAKVPAERIFSTAAAGIGCPGEFESVLLGGKMEVKARFRKWEMSYASISEKDLPSRWEAYLSDTHA